MNASPAAASRRTVTVLFCDIVDSTPLGERLDPETWRRVQRGYFDATRRVLERHGGTVEKFIGDAVMAVFGLPTLHEDDALRALRAASELREAVAPLDAELVRDHGLRLRLRIGVATGEVMAGDPADGSSFATGETVVVAQRIESAARPSEVLVADSTYQLASGAALVEPVEPIPAKGMAQPVPAWRLIGVQPDQPAVARRLDTPLVGRREELEQLRAAFDEVVAERRCRLVAVLGPAGIGKSRLAREFLIEVEAQAAIRIGRCPPYGDGITFWPVADILPDETFEGTTDDIFLRVRRELETLARQQPLVVGFDDVHWGEPNFLNLLEYLVGWITDAPVLVLCLARPELLERRTLPHAESIALEPLSEDDTEALLDVLGAPAEARERIAEAAEGNPLFVEQMAAMANDAGGNVAVPASIRALLAARLDRLSPEERTIIERASIIGREFPLQAVAAISDGAVAGGLMSLVRKELLRPATFEDGFIFRNALIREAAYEALPKALRAELHERHGRWLAERGGADVVIGFHLEQAFRTRAQLGPADASLAHEAGGILAEAGERADRRNDMPAAVTLITRALDLLADDSPQRSEMLAALGSALLRAGRLEESTIALEEAIAQARDTGDRRSELRAVVERQQLRSFTEPAGVVEEIARVAADVIPALEEIGDDFGLAKAWRLLSDAHVFACRWQGRAEALERAVEHARRAPEAKAEASTYVGLLAEALHFGPMPAEEAIARCEGFLEEAGDDLALRASVSVSLGALLAMRGRFDEARAAYSESVELNERLGLGLRRAIFSVSGAEIELLAGDPTAAERELHFAYDQLERMGETGVRAVVSALLAAALLAQDRETEAAQFADTAGSLAEPEDVAAQAFQRSTRARVSLRAGALEAAEELAREAVELAEPTDFLALQADSATALATVLQAAGRPSEAAPLLTRARELYERKGNVVAAGWITGDLAQPRATA
jgi:class 3 adenylate cyclase/tetratricopeptide (TPR) repeat protein